MDLFNKSIQCGDYYNYRYNDMYKIRKQKKKS